MFGFSIYIFAVKNPTITNAVLIFPILILVGCVLIFINIFKRKVILSNDKIICVNLFSKKELNIKAIKGYKIESKLIQLEPLQSTDAKISIGNYFDLKISDKLVKWITDNFKDLNSISLRKEYDKVLQDQQLGLTETDREKNLKKAKAIATAYNIVGFIITFVFIFFNNQISSLLLLFYPIIGIIVIITSKGLIKFLSNKNRSVCSFIMPGFFLPSFLLWYKAIDQFKIFQTNNLWLPSLLISLSIFTLLYISGINRNIESMKGQVIFMCLAALLFGFGSTLEINCRFDNSTAKVYKALVLDHKISHGSRSTSYYLTLSEWGPRKKVQEIGIHKRMYESINDGDSVNVNFHKGLINIPWFIVTKN
jgi:hypothetical protein